MALDFYIVEESLCDPFILDYIYETEKWPLGEKQDGLELGEFSRLDPLWTFLHHQGVEASYFENFYISPELARKARQQLEKLWGEIYLTKPFYHPSDALDPYKRMARLLEKAVAYNSCVIAICD